MPGGSLQVSLSPNHPKHHRSYSRRHENHPYRLPHHYCYPNAAAAVGLEAARVDAQFNDDPQDRQGLFARMVVFLVHHVGRRDEVFSCRG